MIKRIMKHYLFILSKSISFIITFVLSFGILIFVFISIKKEIVNVPLNLLRLTFQGSIFILLLALLVFILSSTLDLTVLTDKITKRLQLFLANGIHLRDIWIGASLANFVSNCTIIFLFEVILLIFLKIIKLNPLQIYNGPFLFILLVNFPLLILIFSFLFVGIYLITRKTEILQIILFGSFFLVNFGGSSLLRYITKKVGIEGNIFTVNVVVVFTLIEIMLLIVILIFRKSLNVEDVTLSIWKER